MKKPAGQRRAARCLEIDIAHRAARRLLSLNAVFVRTQDVRHIAQEEDGIAGLQGMLLASVRQVPEIIPPPPMGAIITSSPSVCSITSRAQVPCPAITRGSL